MKLDELEKLYAVGTPGPWKIDTSIREDREIIYVDHLRSADGNPIGLDRTFQIVGDARLMVAMHTMLPKLIAVARAAQTLTLLDAQLEAWGGLVWLPDDFKHPRQVLEDALAALEGGG